MQRRNRDGSQEGRLGAWVDQEERGSPILEVDKGLVSVRPAPTFKIPAYSFHMDFYNGSLPSSFTSSVIIIKTLL